MSHWIRHFSSKTPVPRPPSLPFSSSSTHLSTSPHSDRYFPCLFLRSPYNLGGEKTESERVQSRDSELCVLRQAGQYSPSRFLACHSNLLDPLSHGQTPCRMSGFYVFVCNRCFMLQFKAFVPTVPHWIDFFLEKAALAVRKRFDTNTLWLQPCSQHVGSPAAADSRMTSRAFRRRAATLFLSNMLACVVVGHVDWF